MAAQSGRTLVIKKGGTVIAGIKEKSMTVNGEAIDITSDDDLGFRTLLGVPGVRSIDLSFSGVSKDKVLTGLILTPGDTDFMLTDITIEFPGAVSTDTVAGDFYFGNIEESASPNDAINFTGSMQSSGAWTYTVGV